MVVLSKAAVLASVAAADFYAVAPGLQNMAPATGAAYALPSSAYAAPAAYVPDVQYLPVDAAQVEEQGWAWSDLALMAVAGATVGTALSRKNAVLAVKGEAPEEDLEAATVAALAVGGEGDLATSKGGALAVGETIGDLQTVAKELCPAVGYYDPLNLAEGEFWGQSQEATIGFLRHAEIKHGRVAMAGFVGYIVHANGIHFPWKIPGDELCAKGVAPTELWQNIPTEAKLQIILTIGLFEFYSESAAAKSPGMGGHYMRGGKPGFFPPFKADAAAGGVKGVPSDGEGRPLLPHPVPLNLYDPFNVNKNKSDEWKAKKLRAEVNNGRLAMLGLMSFLSEGAVPGSVPALKGLIPATGEINVMSPLDFTKPFFG
jgi:hypothetical protein